MQGRNPPKDKYLQQITNEDGKEGNFKIILELLQRFLKVDSIRNRFGLQFAAESKLGLSIYDELFCNIAGVSTSHFFDP